MGMLESRSLSFDYLFVLDVNEGILPGTEKIDPLIPESLKFELGLSSFKDREKLIKYNFFRLIDSSKNVFVFYQRMDKYCGDINQLGTRRPPMPGQSPVFTEKLSVV